MSFLSVGVLLRAFLRSPKGVGAVFPTSSAVVGRIASKMDPRRARLVVEYGPGSGVLTRALLERLRPDGRLVVIELSAELAAGLKSRLHDPRLTVVQSSATQVLEILEDLGVGPVDYVFSSMPFYWLAPEVARQIVADTRAALGVDGTFVPFQTFYLSRRRLRVHLERSFSTVRSEIALPNLPPYRIFEASR